MSARGFDLPGRTRIKICWIASLEEAELAARSKVRRSSARELTE